MMNVDKVLWSCLILSHQSRLPRPRINTHTHTHTYTNTYTYTHSFWLTSLGTRRVTTVCDSFTEYRRSLFIHLAPCPSHDYKTKMLQRLEQKIERILLIWSWITSLQGWRETTASIILWHITIICVHVGRHNVHTSVRVEQFRSMKMKCVIEFDRKLLGRKIIVYANIFYNQCLQVLVVELCISHSV